MVQPSCSERDTKSGFNLINCLLLAISTLVALVFMEVGLRLYFHKSVFWTPPVDEMRKPHPTRGWSTVPGLRTLWSDRDYYVIVTTNSKGLRDVEHSYEPEQGTFRVLVLGDSFMEALQVDLEQSLAKVLEKKLGHKRAEVINFGVSGYGTTQQYLFLKEEGLKYKPKLVILAFYPGNDVRNNSRLLEQMMWGPGVRSFGRPYARVTENDGTKLDLMMPEIERVREYMANKPPRSRSSVGKYLSHSLVLRQLYLVWNAAFGDPKAGKFDPNVYPGWPLQRSYDGSGTEESFPNVETYEKLWQEAWLVTRRLIVAMKNLLDEQGVEFLVVSVPLKLQVDGHFRRRYRDMHPNLKLDVTKINGLLRSFCVEEGIAFLDLLPAFKMAFEEDNRQLFLKFDSHWNAMGHETAAAEIAKYLERRGLGIKSDRHPTRNSGTLETSSPTKEKP